MSKAQIYFMFSLVGALSAIVKLLEYFGIKWPFKKVAASVAADPKSPQDLSNKGVAWAVALCLVSLALSSAGFYSSSQSPPNPTTAENIEKNIRAWLDKHQLYVA
jgi:hypothetical protein